MKPYTLTITPSVCEYSRRQYISTRQRKDGGFTIQWLRHDRRRFSIRFEPGLTRYKARKLAREALREHGYFAPEEQETIRLREKERELDRLLRYQKFGREWISFKLEDDVPAELVPVMTPEERAELEEDIRHVQRELHKVQSQ